MSGDYIKRTIDTYKEKIRKLREENSQLRGRLKEMETIMRDLRATQSFDPNAGYSMRELIQEYHDLLNQLVKILPLYQKAHCYVSNPTLRNDLFYDLYSKQYPSVASRKKSLTEQIKQKS